MPTEALALHELSRVANANWRLAVLFHALVLLALFVFTNRRARPSRWVAGIVLTLPLFSASLFASLYALPIDMAVFVVAGAILAMIGAARGARPVALGPPWAQVVGGVVLAYAWLYPHYLDQPWWAYLYAAPLGLVPSPTLSAVIALGMLVDGLGSRAWLYTVALLGAAYGAIGVVLLHVWLDIGLLLAAAAAALLASTTKPAPSRKPIPTPEEHPA